MSDGITEGVRHADALRARVAVRLEVRRFALGLFANAHAEAARRAAGAISEASEQAVLDELERLRAGDRATWLRNVIRWHDETWDMIDVLSVTDDEADYWMSEKGYEDIRKHAGLLPNALLFYTENGGKSFLEGNGARDLHRRFIAELQARRWRSHMDGTNDRYAVILDGSSLDIVWLGITVYSKQCAGFRDGPETFRLVPDAAA